MKVVNSTSATKCGDSGTDACFCDTQASEVFNQGTDRNNICLRFEGLNETGNAATDGSMNDTERSLYFITTTVDEFTVVSLAGSDLANGSWADNVAVRVEIGGYLSERRAIKKNAYAVTQLTLVVVVDDGHIKDIVWDDSCVACSSSACQDGNCGKGLSYCNQHKHYCDLKIFWSWYGTDKKGNYLLSASERLSRYQTYSAKSYYSDVSSQMSDVDSQYNGYRESDTQQ